MAESVEKSFPDDNEAHELAVKDVANNYGSGDDSGSRCDSASPTMEHQSRIFGYPTAICFILGTEFCERFTYYGITALLVLYLTTEFNMTDDEASAVYSVFSMFSYLTPLFGAIVADQYLGRYMVIAILSVVYCCGNLSIALSAISPSLVGSIIGLLFISVGTGGIKPCVATFGADQFNLDEEQRLSTFYTLFYLSIQLGGLLSMWISPLLKRDVSCTTSGTCYPLAFGVPGALMVIAIVIFLLGTPLYRRRRVADSSIISRFIRTIGSGAWNWLKARRGNAQQHEHWLDYAQTDDKEGVDDFKAVLQIMWVMLPIICFYSVMDQSNALWTLQAARMNGDINGLFTVMPEQTGVVSGILCIVILLILDWIVYPLFAKCGVFARPLKRAALGMFVLGPSFFIAAFLQIAIETSAEQITMAWQIAPMLVLTVAQALVAPQMMCFGYEESPKSTRSAVAAIHLVYMALGDLLNTIIFSSGVFDSHVTQYFVGCGVMILMATLFLWMTTRYRYRRELDDETHLLN